MLARMSAGEIPAIVVVDPWPASLQERVRPVVEQTWTRCASVTTPAVADLGIPASTVTVWLARGRTPTGPPPATP